MSDLGLHGGEGVTIYQLHFHGGPRDSQIENGFRPFYEMQFDDGTYCSERNDDGSAVEEWFDDWTRIIHMYYQHGSYDSNRSP